MSSKVIQGQEGREPGNEAALQCTHKCCARREDESAHSGVLYWPSIAVEVLPVSGTATRAVSAARDIARQPVSWIPHTCIVYTIYI